MAWNPAKAYLDERSARSISEVDRLYSKEFSDSLARMVGLGAEFLREYGSRGLGTRERFEAFWDRAGDVNADMLLLYSRLAPLVDCIQRGYCDREQVYARFPEPVYPSIHFMREFVILTPELERHESSLNSWWMDEELYGFLADYCAWAFDENDGEMNLWSPYLESLRYQPEESYRPQSREVTLFPGLPRARDQFSMALPKA